jgi:hypothetical protein
MSCKTQNNLGEQRQNTCEMPQSKCQKTDESSSYAAREVHAVTITAFIFKD